MSCGVLLFSFFFFLAECCFLQWFACLHPAPQLLGLLRLWGRTLYAAKMFYSEIVKSFFSSCWCHTPCVWWPLQHSPCRPWMFLIFFTVICYCWTFSSCVCTSCVEIWYWQCKRKCVILFVNIWDMFVYNAPSAVCIQYIVGYITVYIYNIVNTILWKIFRYNSYSESQKH